MLRKEDQRDNHCIPDILESINRQAIFVAPNVKDIGFVETNLHIFDPLTMHFLLD